MEALVKAAQQQQLAAGIKLGSKPLVSQSLPLPSTAKAKDDSDEVVKKKKLVIPNSGFDFQNAVNEFGFIKARQMMKQHTAAAQQAALSKADKDEFVTRHPLRLAQAIKLSKTLGKPNSESACDKIIETTAKRAVVREGQSKVEAERDFSVDVSLQRSLISHDASLLLAQVGLEALPNAMGDTLFLQCSFLKTISIPRNNIFSLLSHHHPQISMFHLRYLTELNVAGNKLKHLPSEMGLLTNLTSLNIGFNTLACLPMSIGKLKALKSLNCASNNINSLPYEIRHLNSLEELHMSGNICSGIPAAVTALRSLRILDMSRNMLTHMGIPDAITKTTDLWYEVIDETTGKMVFCNKLTHERVKKIELYDGRGIQKDPYLHNYHDKKSDPIQYRRRKMWLASSGIYEWDVIRDVLTGQVYFQNNVSGTSTWEIPSDIDTLGNCPCLEELRLDRNTIQVVSTSTATLATLRVMSIHTNRIHTLPEQWAKMASLETLDLHNNELKLLPPTLCECKNLVNLLVFGNRLLRLPTLLGTLPKLAKIDAASNCLTQIPFSLGYSESLQDLNVSENPLTDPPLEEVVKGNDSLKWYLRNRLLIEQRGMPPVMEFHDMGIMHEVTVLAPEIKDKIRQILDNSKATGLVNLQLMGLTEIPRQLFKCTHIKKLQLDYNNHLKLNSVQGFAPELASLRYLSIKSCKIPSLPENIKNLKRLVHLSLEENQLESLPSTMSTLRSLQLLDLSKNMLHSLPPGLERLEDLKTFNLEGNRIEYLPEAYGALTSLVSLHLGRNRLTLLPDSLCRLPSLKKLNVESNCLFALPEHIGRLPLSDLRIGHNRIEWLPYDIFEYELGRNIKVFSACENNLTELPLSLHKIDPEGLMEADFNPLISPPSYLLTEGLRTVQNYLRIRTIRINEFSDLLEAEDFEFVRENISPVACNVLADGTGFLNPNDLAEFDLAANEFLNNEYFKCPASGQEIVDKLVKLREFRENELYLTCLRTLIVVLDTLSEDPNKVSKGFGDSVLTTTKRPWARKGEQQTAYVLCKECLMRESPPNDFHRNTRPSVLSLVQETLPDMAIPFSVDLLMDSVELFTSPYGQVAGIETHVFSQCDCVDERNKPVRHKTCAKEAIVLSMIVFNDEEASRRELEEDEIYAEFKETQDLIRIWLMSTEGKKCLEKEVKRRVQVVQMEFRLIKEMVAAGELALLKAREYVASLHRRKRLMDQGESIASHGFESLQDAVNQIDDADEAVKKQENRNAALNEMRNELAVKLNISHVERRRIAAEDLMQKYCVDKFNIMSKRFRKIAAKYKLRRPWDGENGVDYREWFQRTMGGQPPKFAPGEGMKAEFGVSEEVGALAAREIAEVDASNSEEMQQFRREQEERRAAAQASQAALLPEYDWSGTEDMKKLACYMYDRFRYGQQVAAEASEKHEEGEN